MTLLARDTNIQQQQPAIRLVHDARLNKRELLLRTLHKLLRAGIPVFLGPAIRDTIPISALNPLPRDSRNKNRESLT